jgi:hypothetical protein
LSLKANKAVRFFPVLKEDKGRYASDVVSGGNSGIFIHIDLHDRRICREFLGDGFDCRRHCAAWTAPRRPEVDEDRFFRLHDEIFKAGFVEFFDMAIHVYIYIHLYINVKLRRYRFDFRGIPARRRSSLMYSSRTSVRARQ